MYDTALGNKEKVMLFKQQNKVGYVVSLSASENTAYMCMLHVQTEPSFKILV